MHGAPAHVDEQLSHVGRHDGLFLPAVHADVTAKRAPHPDLVSAHTQRSRMPSAVACTQQLLTAVRNNDAVATVHCVAAFVPADNVVADDPSDWKTAGEVLIAAVNMFPSQALLSGLALAALHRVGEWSDHVDAVVSIASRFQRGGDGSAKKVVQCAARLLQAYVLSPRGMEKLPSVVTAAARWIEWFPDDEYVAYWCGIVLTTAAAIEPVDIKRLHGQSGVEAVAVGLVHGCTATRVTELTIEHRPWNQWVLDKLFPRMRPREAAAA